MIHSILIKVLIENNLAKETKLTNWKQKAEKSGQSLFQFITQHELIHQNKLLLAIHKTLNYPTVNLNSFSDKKTFQLVNETHNTEKLAVIQQKSNHHILIIANPEDTTLAERTRFQTGKQTDIVFAPYNQLINLRNKLKLQQLTQKNLTTISASKLTDVILSTAIHKNASDIHFEPQPLALEVRYRIDGLLHHCITIPKTCIESITNFLKVAAKLDISIKRSPQDGRFSTKSDLGFIKDVRMSTYPTSNGEKIVIRLLDTDSQIKNIDTLGLPKDTEKTIKKIVAEPQGLVLITGPTGSGKSVTLYSLLQLRNTTTCNITTIEDPIEIEITGINQSTINPKIGFDFPNALRALLRQDPDVIMIGEIRDKETAQMAIRAAQTGHLVLSTLHTNNATDTIPRLLNMGIAPFQLSQALSLIVAQRLVRRLCEHCKTKDHSQNLKNKYFQANGCAHCEKGFKGRIGVFETIVLNKSTAPELFKTNFHKYKTKKANHQTLWQAALAHAKAGTTSLSEIYRVVPYNE